MSEIKNELDTLPKRAMLAAAFITYLSAAPEDRRRHCLETWMDQSGLQSKSAFQANALTTTYASSDHKHPSKRLMASVCIITTSVYNLS